MEPVSIVRDASRSGTDLIGDVRLDWAVRCDVGRVRDSNEDAALVLPGIYLIADGMGGHECGEVASETALRTLADVEGGGDLSDTQMELIDLVDRAQQRIGEIETESERRAGTTISGAVLVSEDDENHWLVLNIGDSRTYRYSADVLTQLSRDHSQVQELVDADLITAEEARIDPRRNVITRALGAGMVEPVAEYFSTLVEPGDMLMVCSDGLTGELPDDEIADTLADISDPADVADALVSAALALGGHDNITVIVVAVSAADADTDDEAADSGVDTDSEGDATAASE